ncbi:MAG: DUF805 domain-containing protein [Succinivibrio sp.]|nr:DUF805 domain-containing protein [Succinivibrio sp.]
MQFIDAVSTCLLKKYHSFEGRASRSEFWWFMLFFMICFVLTELSVEVFWLLLTQAGILVEQNMPALLGLALPYLSLCIVCLILLTPLAAVTVRRMHDVNKSGKLILLPTVVMLVSILSALAAKSFEQPTLLMFGAALSSLAGILAIACFMMTLIKGTSGPNRFGADPLFADL